MKDIEKSKFHDIDNQFKQDLIRKIDANFPNYSLAEATLSTHKHKMAELRKLFRLQEFSKNFTQKDFEQARNKARENQGFPAENIQKTRRPYDLFLQDVIKQGQWTTPAEVGQLWKQLSSKKRSDYEERSKSLKHQCRIRTRQAATTSQ